MPSPICKSLIFWAFILIGLCVVAFHATMFLFVIDFNFAFSKCLPFQDCNYMGTKLCLYFLLYGLVCVQGKVGIMVSS
jgi:hypothetical protein